MIFTATNLFSERFIKVSNTDKTTLGSIYTGLVIEKVLSDEPDSWLDVMGDFSDIAGALDKVKREFFDPSVIKHRPQTTTVTLKAIVELTGLPQARAALVAYLFSECRISGYDVDYNYRHHINIDASRVPNTKQVLAAALAGKFFTEEFAPKVEAAIGRAKTFVSQGASFKSERVYILSDTAVPNSVSEFKNALKTIQIRAIEGCSEEINYRASHYEPHVLRAVSQSVLYHCGCVADGAEAQLALCRDKAAELAKCRNFVADATADQSKLANLLQNAVSPGLVNMAASIIASVGTEDLPIYKRTSGLEYLGVYLPSEVVKGERAAYLIPSVAESNKPIAEVVARTPGYMGIEMRPVASSTKAVVAIAQNELSFALALMKNLSTTVALAKTTGRPIVRNLMKDWVAKLKTIPRAVLLDVLFDQGSAARPMSYSAGSLRYYANCDWSAIALLSGDPRYAGIQGQAPFSDLNRAVFAICVSYPVPDVDVSESAALSSVYSRGRESIEIDSEWLDSLLSDDGQKESGLGTTLGIVRKQFNNAAVVVVTPAIAKTLQDMVKKGEKLDTAKLSSFTRIVDKLWDDMGIVGTRKVILAYDRQVVDRIARLSNTLMAMISDLAPSSAGAIALTYLRELALRARAAFGGLAAGAMTDAGASFNFDEHMGTYDVELNVAFSLTSINMLVSVVRVVAPDLAKLITQLVDWGSTYTIKTGIRVFDVGSLKKDLGYV